MRWKVVSGFSGGGMEKEGKGVRVVLVKQGLTGFYIFGWTGLVDGLDKE